MLGVFDHARPATPRLGGVVGVAFHIEKCLGTWELISFAAQYPAYMYPCQRFEHGLAAVSA
jgi:hypothetical protein